MSPSTVKSALKRLVPSALIERYRRARTSIQIRANRHATPERIFTAIYERNLWGGRAGEFHSGSGSATAGVTAPYVDAVRRFLVERGLTGMKFVDLGCGDFRVGRELIPLCREYVGVDVVRGLIERNQRSFSEEGIRFLHLDIVSGALPDGDVCFLRQVLQHLSNAQIAEVLLKVKRYCAVVITEHLPSRAQPACPNVDKVPGHHTRLTAGSGVILTEPPFNLPAERVESLVDVQAPAIDGVADAGVIRTIIYWPRGPAARPHAIGSC